MTRYKLKNGKKLNMPDSWNDVSYSKGIRLMSENMSNVKVFSLLSGISEEEVRDMKGYDDIYYFMEGFTFLKTFPENFDLPMSVKIDGKHVHLPFVDKKDMYDFGESSVGQIEDMKAEVKKDIEAILEGEERDLTPVENVSLMPKIVALYLQGVDNGYDYEKAIGMSDKVKEQLSIQEVISMGGFFLIRLTNSMSGQTLKSQKSRPTQKILKLASKTLTSHLGFMRR